MKTIWGGELTFTARFLLVKTMPKERVFPEACSICQMHRPVFGFGFNVPEWTTVRTEYPNLPDLNEIYLCPLCVTILIQKGVWKLELTKVKIGVFLEKMNELWKAAKVARDRFTQEREEHRREMETIRTRIRENASEVRRLEQRTGIRLREREPRRRTRRRVRTPAGSTDEDPLGW